MDDILTSFKGSMGQPHQLGIVHSNPKLPHGLTVMIQGVWGKENQGTRQILGLICVEGLMSASVAIRGLAWHERTVDNQ